TIFTNNTTGLVSNVSQVTITGVIGNSAANGTWTVTNVNPGVSFDLVGAPAANGNWTSGGTWTSTAPLVVTTASTAGLTTGAQVTVAGVQGNPAANSTWTITVIDGTHFSLNGSTGTGTYTTGGTWIKGVSGSYNSGTGVFTFTFSGGALAA